eukprot:gene14053-15514_t
MDDKDKFLSEWKQEFPNEEPPDISFFNSINELNIRSKIIQCEKRIGDLELQIKKEQFILNWLVTLDIEISVLGNVGGISKNNVDDGNRRPSANNKESESTREINDQTIDGKMESNVMLDAGNLEEEKLTRNLTTQDIEHATININKMDIKTESHEQVESLPEDNTKHVKDGFEILNLVDDEVGEEPEYENVSDLLSFDEHEKTLTEESVKTQDNRRAGGSWSVYVDGDGEERGHVASNQSNSFEENARQDNAFDYESPIYEEIRFIDGIPRHDDNNDGNDNVTVNVTYEPTKLKPLPPPRKDICEPEEESEAIYENITDLMQKNTLIPSGIRLDGNDSASDYDSDGGKHETKMTTFRHMTIDEINNLRKWQSDEDLSQSSHDLDDKSLDSDDGTDATSSVPFENQDQKHECSLPAVKQIPKPLQKNQSVESEAAEESEEDGTTNRESQKMRTYLVRNLLESEKCYYDCLDMVKKYMKPLEKSTETSQPILTKMEFDKIFLGINSLYDLHRDLLEQLKTRILNWDENQVIGDLLTILMDGFSVYKDYINNYKSSQETLLKCRNANAQLDNILQKNIKIPSLKDPIKFDALLYKPVDRMTQYSLILNDLLKNTPEDHPDNELLSEATANLFDLFEQVNVNRTDKKAPKRQLLKEANVVELIEGERKMRTLILMNDVIICAKLKPSKETYVCKWYLSLVDIQLKPFKESECAQTVPVTTKSECDKLRATIANFRSEMRKDSLVPTQSVSSDSTSPFVRPKFRKRDSVNGPASSRASTRGMEKLRKKLQEQERLLELIAPSFPFNIYHKNGKTYTLLLPSKDDKIFWKDAIEPRIKRMISRKPESVHLSSNEIQQALEISYRVHRLGVRFGAMIPSSFFANEIEDDKNSDGLTGYLYVHIKNGKSFSKTVEFYCVLEVDSYGYFFRKGKTKPSKGSEPSWDEDFEFDIEAASSLRLSCYSNRSRLLGDEFSGKVTIDLLKENLTDTMSHTFSVMLDKQGAVTLTISFSSTIQGIERSRTNASSTNVFKLPLASVTRREKFDIPLVVISCVKEIEKRGLEEVGIYRLSGIASEVKSLKQSFDENPQSAVLALAQADIHAVAGLIKLYFRELPEPLFTNSRYPRFVSGLQISDPEEKELYMTELLQQLPKPNKLTALYLLEHLRRVSQNEKVNKMGVNNLSTVFGPTVLRPSVVDSDRKKNDNLRSGGTTFDIGALDVMSQEKRIFIWTAFLERTLQVDEASALQKDNLAA